MAAAVKQSDWKTADKMLSTLSTGEKLRNAQARAQPRHDGLFISQACAKMPRQEHNCIFTVRVD